MARPTKSTVTPRRTRSVSKYDAHHSVLNQAYGAFAALRQQLSDSKTAVSEREELLRTFGNCPDPQRSWLVLEDYFERLNLSRRDFPDTDWWPKMLAVMGKARLEQLAFLFLKARRTPPTELSAFANSERFAAAQAAEREQDLIRHLEDWLFPHAPEHLDAPRAALRVVCEAQPVPEQPWHHQFIVQFLVQRQRAGEKAKTIAELVDLTTRATHEAELFTPRDWEFILWLAETYKQKDQPDTEKFALSEADLFHWLTRWGHTGRLESANGEPPFSFQAQMAELLPHLETSEDLAFTHRLRLPDGSLKTVAEMKFFSSRPPLVLAGQQFCLLRNAPPASVLEHWAQKPSIPVTKLSHRLLLHLRKSQEADPAVNWEQLCIVHHGRPQFTFELLDETIQLRLLARSERDESLWMWTGHVWQPEDPQRRKADKPEIMDDARLEPAADWLRKFDWFTPEPGLWVGDANDHGLSVLALAWSQRPADADYLGDAAFHRLFLQPRRLKPRLVVKGSGIDWLSVSAEWEEEGLRLSPADLERLAHATGRFVKLPNAGWVELDTGAVQAAHETMADLGVDGLIPVAQKIGLENAAHLDEEGMARFAESPQALALRERIKDFRGVAPVKLPNNIHAELRPYQKEGYDFLCHLNDIKLGGILADDMGLGKTLQTLCWIAWLRDRYKKDRKPALVICPASVLHNWRREAERFTPDLKTLILQSGAERHNLRKQIPEFDLIVTNYALLRRDLEDFKKFQFSAVILDEAQFIKNPEAQVTQAVKELVSGHRLALTGTPLENRLLDLWSIIDFVQPTYLGSQEHFLETYDPRGVDADQGVIRIARRKLASKIRPLMLRRLKRQVAKDLPERIEQRQDCELGEEQRKLYLAELRRSRDQVFKAVSEKGIGKSKLMVLAALTRLRQICCHPRLVGSDSPSGKTDTLFELLEQLQAENQKVLVFSQFVQMLELLQRECALRQMKTHILTGQTKQRAEVVNAFQDDPDSCIFLLSLRAAGTGLNLTAASYVVLYDPWWNPAVEAQAIDRSHRIGQTQTVNAYRLISPGTVEEKIWDLQQSKAQTINDVLGEEGFARSLTTMDLEYLFSEE
jgi:superfamily II DNA or RNA helicase